MGELSSEKARDVSAAMKPRLACEADRVEPRAAFVLMIYE
jgi:hypothetical protein